MKKILMKGIKYTILYCVFVTFYYCSKTLIKFRFRFHKAKCYGSYDSGSGSITLPTLPCRNNYVSRNKF